MEPCIALRRKLCYIGSQHRYLSDRRLGKGIDHFHHFCPSPLSSRAKFASFSSRLVVSHPEHDGVRCYPRPVSPLECRLTTFFSPPALILPTHHFQRSHFLPLPLLSRPLNRNFIIETILFSCEPRIVCPCFALHVGIDWNGLKLMLWNTGT